MVAGALLWQWYGMEDIALNVVVVVVVEVWV
jgi:hypothetical protein